MIKPRRIGHATFDTPDLEKAVAYYERFMGLVVAEREKERAFLASKVGPLVIQLDQAERDALVGVYNNDMVATSWDPATRYWVLSWDGSTNVINSSVIAAAERLGYSPSLSPVTTRGASDHQSFQEVGIASANFSWRGEATPALLEPPYHSPEDTIEKNISMDRLTVSMELIGCAAYALAH